MYPTLGHDIDPAHLSVYCCYRWT